MAGVDNTGHYFCTLYALSHYIRIYTLKKTVDNLLKT